MPRVDFSSDRFTQTPTGNGFVTRCMKYHFPSINLLSSLFAIRDCNSYNFEFPIKYALNRALILRTGLKLEATKSSNLIKNCICNNLSTYTCNCWLHIRCRCVDGNRISRCYIECMKPILLMNKALLLEKMTLLFPQERGVHLSQVKAELLFSENFSLQVSLFLFVNYFNESRLCESFLTRRRLGREQAIEMHRGKIPRVQPAAIVTTRR